MGASVSALNDAPVQSCSAAQLAVQEDALAVGLAAAAPAAITGPSTPAVATKAADGARSIGLPTDRRLNAASRVQQAALSAHIAVAMAHAAKQQVALLAADVGLPPELDPNDPESELARCPQDLPEPIMSTEWTEYVACVEHLGAEGLRRRGCIRVPREAKLVDRDGRLGTGDFICRGRDDDPCTLAADLQMHLFTDRNLI